MLFNSVTNRLFLFVFSSLPPSSGLRGNRIIFVTNTLLNTDTIRQTFLRLGRAAKNCHGIQIPFALVFQEARKERSNSALPLRIEPWIDFRDSQWLFASIICRCWANKHRKWFWMGATPTMRVHLFGSAAKLLVNQLTFVVEFSLVWVRCVLSMFVWARLCVNV